MSRVLEDHLGNALQIVRFYVEEEKPIPLYEMFHVRHRIASALRECDRLIIQWGTELWGKDVEAPASE